MYSRYPPSHLSLWCGLWDDDCLPQFWLQIHFIISVAEKLPLDGGHRLAWRTEEMNNIRNTKINYLLGWTIVSWANFIWPFMWQHNIKCNKCVLSLKLLHGGKITSFIYNIYIWKVTTLFCLPSFFSLSSASRFSASCSYSPLSHLRRKSFLDYKTNRCYYKHVKQRNHIRNLLKMHRKACAQDRTFNKTHLIILIV